MLHKMKMEWLAGVAMPALLCISSSAVYSQTPQVSGGAQIIDSQAIVKYVNDTDIVAQADGLISGIAVDEGKSIKANQVLIELDTRLALADLKVASKGYEADNEKAQNRSEIEFNELSYKLAKKISENHRVLMQKGATSEGEYDKVLLEEDKARLGGVVSELKLRTDQLTAEVSKAKMEAAQVQVDLRQIKAPFDGIVAERKKQPNDYVRTGEKIVRLVGMERLYVIGRIPAADVGGSPHLLENAQATVVISMYRTATNPGKEIRIPCTVSFVSPVQGEDGRYRVKVEIANIQDDGHWVLRDGVMATLIINSALNAPNRR